MKIKDIIETIKRAKILNLKLIYEPVDKSSASFRGLNAFHESLDLLERTGLFQQQVKYLRSSVLSHLREDGIKLEGNYSKEVNEVIEYIEDLLNQMDESVESLEKSMFDERTNSIIVKLYGIQNFSDLANTCNAIQNILGQTILHDDIKGTVEISNVTNGSIVFGVFLGTSAAVSLVAGMTWAGAVIYKKMQEAKIMSIQADNLNIRNESFKKVQEAQELILNHIVAAEATLLVNEHYKEQLPEQIERMKNSVKLMADIIDKGAEIHPSLTAPENVANLFPDPKKYLTITSKLKELGEGKQKSA